MLQSCGPPTLPSRTVIGVFDSGLGGLSVAREIRRLDPDAGILYLGDRAWAPYGGRTLDELRMRSEAITAHLLAAGAESIVVACNTASAAALVHLRGLHPDVVFVGMEPAVKPAATLTRSGTIGVLATPATFRGDLYASVVDRFAGDVRVIETVCPGWVEAVERPTDPARRAALVEEFVKPTVAAGADVLVLGCTHYPFLVSEIRAAAGPDVAIVDPGPAVAAQVLRVVPRPTPGPFEIEVTGPTDAVAERVRELIGLAPPVRAVTLAHGVH